MRAQNLTISVPPGDKLCDKNCEYCVSRMTGYMKPNWHLMEQNAHKVEYLAKAAQVSSVLFTGKGEPTLNEEALFWLMNFFSDFPLELQTNGRKLSKDFGMLDVLSEHGLNTLAVSIDDLATFVNYYELFARSKELDFITRATVNITNKLPKDITFEWLINLCKESYIDQLMLRNVVVPNNAAHSPETRKWINENVDQEMYSRLQDELRRVCETKGMMLRILNFGSVVYDYRGVAVTYSDYCVQDSNNGKDIRSLIFMEDGHCYTSWNSKASILF